MGAYELVNLDVAVASAEGFYLGTNGGVTTRAQRNNNPGNLVYNDYTKSLGATGADDKGFAIFHDSGVGFQALDDFLVTEARKGLTIDQLAQVYDPPTAPGNSPASTAQWAKNVASLLGATTDETLLRAENVYGVVPITLPPSAGSTSPSTSPNTSSTSPSASPSTTPAAVPGSPVTGSGGGSSPVSGVLNGLSGLSPGDVAAGMIPGFGAASFLGLPLSRIGIFILALIVIAGAIFLFKPVQSIAIKAGKKAVTAAAL